MQIQSQSMKPIPATTVVCMPSADGAKKKNGKSAEPTRALFFPDDILLPETFLSRSWVGLWHLFYCIYLRNKNLCRLRTVSTNILHLNRFNKPGGWGSLWSEMMTSQVTAFERPLSRLSFLLLSVLFVGFKGPWHDVIVIIIHVWNTENTTRNK